MESQNAKRNEQNQRMYVYARELKNAGHTDEQIFDDLVRNGVHPKTAHSMIYYVRKNKIWISPHRKEGLENLLHGFILFVVSAAFTTVTFKVFPPDSTFQFLLFSPLWLLFGLTNIWGIYKIGMGVSKITSG